MIRTCIDCGHKGPKETDFPCSGGSTFRRRCKSCYSSSVREWQKKNDSPDVRKQKNITTRAWRKRMKLEGRSNEIWRKHLLRSKYGLSLEQYDAMLIAQNGVCAICKKSDPEGKALAVDHDHITGENRGLLCGLCNKAIGLLQDSAELVIKAAEYLNSFKPKICVVA